MTIYIVEELNTECQSWHPVIDYGIRDTREDGVALKRRIKTRFPDFQVRVARYDRVKEITDNAAGVNG